MIILSRFKAFRRRTLCEVSAAADSTLMYDIGNNCCCCLPRAFRQKVQCGVPFEEIDVEDEKVKGTSSALSGQVIRGVGGV